MRAGTHTVTCRRAQAAGALALARPRHGNLRWFRTSLLGRAPGFAPGPPLVGPWRPVDLVDPAVLRVDVRTALDGRDGVVAIHCGAAAGELDVTIGGVTERLPAGGGTVRVPGPELWWPHTHGDPVLHAIHIRAEAAETQRSVGFRQLTHAADVESDGLDLHVNGVPVFSRGAVWTPTPPDELRATLERARDAGLNLIRVVGTMVYEDAAFHDACDELGLLVWQDLMFANMDYPFADDGFAALAEQEVRQALHEVAGRPSLALICGNSEIEQQVAMLGLPPSLGRDEFFASTVPDLVRSLGIDAAYIPSAPAGGVLPFRTDRGVANYFGVGAYLRDVVDVRRACVRFASECLAFANVPNEDPASRSAGVMRDVGADWDFADVRDHYLRVLHDTGPADADYWERSRHVTGELMSNVFGEWRRGASESTGGIVLWLRDLAPGAGWGVLDNAGRPKLAWHYLRRTLAPVAVWLVDEGLNGVSVHVANDTREPVTATLRLALYRDEETLVGLSEEPLVLAPHSSWERDAEGLLGRFVDIGFAYRFGEPQQDTVVATLEREGQLVSQAFFYPVHGPPVRRTTGELGLTVTAHPAAGGAEVTLTSRRLVRGVRLQAPGLEALEDGLDLEPGRGRSITLKPIDAEPRIVSIRALNLSETLEIAIG